VPLHFLAPLFDEQDDNIPKRITRTKTKLITD